MVYSHILHARGRGNALLRELFRSQVWFPVSVRVWNLYLNETSIRKSLYKKENQGDIDYRTGKSGGICGNSETTRRKISGELYQEVEEIKITP